MLPGLGLLGTNFLRQIVALIVLGATVLEEALLHEQPQAFVEVALRDPHALHELTVGDPVVLLVRMS